MTFSPLKVRVRLFGTPEYIFTTKSNSDDFWYADTYSYVLYVDLPKLQVSLSLAVFVCQS